MMASSVNAISPDPIRDPLGASDSAEAVKLASPEVAKLRKAAGEFESILLESLWKSMKETFSDPNEDEDPTVKSFDDWGIHAMAGAVGNEGGLGIKKLILKYLEPTISAGAAGGEPASRQYKAFGMSLVQCLIGVSASGLKLWSEMPIFWVWAECLGKSESSYSRPNGFLEH